MDSAGFTNLYMAHFFDLHNLPFDIVCNRGTVSASGVTEVSIALAGVAIHEHCGIPSGCHRCCVVGQRQGVTADSHIV